MSISDPILDKRVAAIITISSIVIVFFMSIGNSSIQTKVYTVCATISFTTAVLGVVMNEKLGASGNMLTIGLNIALLIVIVAPQLMYISTVSRHSYKITMPEQLAHNGITVTISTITMLAFLAVIFLANTRTGSDVNMFMLMSLLGCTVLSAITGGLIRIMDKRLYRMNDNVAKPTL